MKNKNSILETGKQTFISNGNAIANLVNFSTGNFDITVKFIHNSKGRF